MRDLELGRAAQLGVADRGDVDRAVVREVEEDVARGERGRSTLLVAEDEVDPPASAMTTGVTEPD